MINPCMSEQENKQEICDCMLLALLHTYNAGCLHDNPLAELTYIPEKEIVRPIFLNGAGRNGEFDINVRMDSGTSMIIDIANQFIKKMW